MLPRGDAETEPGRDSVSQIRKTRKGEWWQFHGRSSAGVSIGCATVMHLRNVSGATGPKSSGTSCFARRSCKLCLAMDKRRIGVKVHEPQLRLVGYAHVCSLRGICHRLSRHVAFALQRQWLHVVRRSPQRHSRLPPIRNVESDIWWQRPTHDGRLHRVTSWRRSVLLGPSFWAKWELQSHTRGVLLSLAPACCGCVDQFAARGSRTSPAPDAWLRTHQNVRSRGFFTDSSTHDQHANSSSKSQKPEPRQERDLTKEETTGSYPF